MFGTLKKNVYPGRGILIGKSDDGKSAVIAYFIMGRSVNSRNRRFEEYEGGMKTVAIDASKLSDPSLVIYSPVADYNNHIIVTNGDQTDTIAAYISENKTMAQALQTREYEPDEPNYTPRISSVTTLENGDFKFSMSILKRDASGNCGRLHFHYDGIEEGKARLIHTYAGDGNPIPSFVGEPAAIDIYGGIEDFTNELWSALNNENKVALYVRYVDLESGESRTKIIGK
ncbi:MAG: IMP cyclohydrolase [Clostridiaceae bacterium]|jgi:IMP cyclohydrolase|nr:IMP cyclohydrolase [Clostridiaceae bacterium]